MEDNFRDSDRRFRELVEFLPVIVFETSLQGNLTFVNDIVTSILGYNRDEMLGRPFFNFIAPEDVIRCIATSRNVMSGIFLGDNEFVLVRKNGTRISTFIQSAPNINSRGELIGLRGVVLDISKQKGIEAGLRESEQKYRTLINHIKLGVVRTTIGDDGRFLEFNKAMEEISGYSREELLSMKVISIYANPLDRKEFFQDIFHTEQTIYREVKLKRKDGSEIIASLILTPVKDNGGNILYLDGILEDITERKRAEQILKESENKFRILAEQSSNMIFINTGSRIIYVNNRCEEVLGYSKEEYYAPDFSFINIVAPESREMVISNFSKRKQGEDIGSYEYILMAKDGKKIPAIISMSAIRYENSRVYIGTVTDITERKKMEKAIIELYEKEKKERLELQEEARSRGLFTDVLAHELRTPLTPILVSTGMLKNYTGEQGNDIRQKLIDNIYFSTQTLARRLEELLDLARYSRGTFKLYIQPMAFDVFIRGVIARFKPSLDQRKQILVEEIPDILPEVQIDASRLEQVIINLLSNAGKFSRDEGVILCRVSIVDQEIQVDIRDNGIGIPLDSQERLFQPYHRVEQDRQLFPGLGLGLTVARQIVESHGGKIWLHSQPGKGSTFSFRIPLAGPPSPAMK
jgi:PAS domain S-box-containing protein